MARPDKAAAVAELTDEFRSCNAVVLTEYRGLTVKQLQDLRRALGENASYAVVKNTLTKIAARAAGVDGFEDLLVGPSAIAFVKGDPVEAAKSLRDFARANSPLVIKGGVLDGKSLTPAEISRIADLESREVLLGRLAGALLASLQNAASLFNAPLSQAARVVAALRDKAEEDPSILVGGAGTAVSSEATSTPDVDESADAAGTDGSSDSAVVEAAADVPATAEGDPEAPSEEASAPTSEEASAATSEGTSAPTSEEASAPTSEETPATSTEDSTEENTAG